MGPLSSTRNFDSVEITDKKPIGKRNNELGLSVGIPRNGHVSHLVGGFKHGFYFP